MDIKPNQLKIETTKIEADERSKVSNARIFEAGQVMKPEYTEYLGTVCIHFYKDRFSADPKPSFIVQPVSLDVPENVMIAGLTVLRNKMMEFFGHKAPRNRT